MASKAATTAAKAIYAEVAFVPKGPINAGRFNLIREIFIGSALGVSAGLVWKSWHWGEKRRMAQYYSELYKKEKADEDAYKSELRSKLQALEEELMA
jgi:hypothetical protein